VRSQTFVADDIGLTRILNLYFWSKLKL